MKQQKARNENENTIMGPVNGKLETILRTESFQNFAYIAQILAAR